MAEILGYCVKCKAKQTIQEGNVVTMKNKRLAYKGKCPTCGTGMFRILSHAEQEVMGIHKSIPTE